ncbi:hypothetical protein HNR60_001723 [Rhodopseudomonas rhenobacensis]|uniref:Uncharacterized protein n=1 Tax=Rhodopseudomonas rhenobacensis TaxID=87461 RepID=A0A7W7Z2W5_9BRAD|nr:hypothetical protein [Rhodopseudomonas rhenobacensis]MBB5046974.1 hypothetical protein [Rhodopseudomonas rhenobacensis]
MTVTELIGYLQTLPGDYNVSVIDDGCEYDARIIADEAERSVSIVAVADFHPSELFQVIPAPQKVSVAEVVNPLKNWEPYRAALTGKPERDL